jgi:hypothetical protein
MVLNINIKAIATVILFATLVAKVNAQEKGLCTEVLKKYNSSVAARLYQVNSYDLSGIPCAQQLQMASLINQKDSILVYSLSAGGDLKSVQKNIETIEYRINTLASVNTSSMADRAAQKELSFYTTAYKLAPADSIMLYKFFTNKNRSLNRLMHAGSDTSSLFSEVFTFIVYKKPVIDILNKYESYNYFDKQVQELSHIKPLADTGYKKLRSRYYELLAPANRYSNKDRFELAFKQTISDTTYYSKLLRNQINDIAVALNISDRRSILQYKPSRECMDTILKVISKKNYQIGLLALANDGDPRRREAIIKNEAAQYDSLIQVLLMKDGAFITSGIMNAAIKYRKILNLRNTQVDSLIERAIWLDRAKDSAWMADAFAPYDAKDYESIWLSRIMDDDQLAHLLSMKYSRDARKNAENDWADLEKRGLTENMTKETVMKELTVYYIKTKAATTMYYYDQDKNSAYSRSVRDAAPASLKLLQYARKNNVFKTDAKKTSEP